MNCHLSQYKGIQTVHLLPKKCSKCEAVKKRRDKFIKDLQPFVEQYGKEMMNAFFKYWAELNKSQTKMRWEMEKVWQLNLRLARWAANAKFESKPKGMPEFYDRKYEATLTQTEAMAYTQKLVSLGFKPIRSQEGTIVNWVK